MMIVWENRRLPLPLPYMQLVSTKWRFNFPANTNNNQNFHENAENYFGIVWATFFYENPKQKKLFEVILKVIAPN